MRKRVLALCLCVCLCLTLIPIARAAEPAMLSYAEKLGLMVYSSIEDWDKPLTRLQVAELFAGLLRWPVEDPGEGFLFSDCDHLNAQQRAAVYTVVNNHLLQGVSEGIFAPNDSVTRAAVATMIYRAIGAPNVEKVDLPFTDAAAISPWASDAVAGLYALHIIPLPPSGQFRPNDSATGAEALDWLIATSEYFSQNDADYQTPTLLFLTGVVELFPGDELTLKAARVPYLSGAGYTFETSDPGVVQVMKSGNSAVTLAGVALGTATVTVTCGDCVAQCQVTVGPRPPVWPTAISLPASYYIQGGGWLEITPERTPSSSGIPAYTITSSDESVVKVKTEGTSVMIYGVKSGTVTIRVTAGEGVFAESEITVRGAWGDVDPEPPEGVLTIEDEGYGVSITFDGFLRKETHQYLWWNLDDDTYTTREHTFYVLRDNSSVHIEAMPDKKYAPKDYDDDFVFDEFYPHIDDYAHVGGMGPEWNEERQAFFQGWGGGGGPLTGPYTETATVTPAEEALTLAWPLSYEFYLCESDFNRLVPALTEEMFTVDTTDEAYTGDPIIKAVTSELKLGADYTVVYKNNTETGTATITITGMGNYAGTLEYTFAIVRVNSGSMESSDGKSLDWTCSETGRVTVSGELAAGETVLAACYDDQGRLTELKLLTRDALTAQLEMRANRVKLFWLNDQKSPMSQAAIAWEN